MISIGVFCASFYVLFKKWLGASTRYYSDLPFILSFGYIFLIVDRMDSILGLTGIMPITITSQLINFISLAMVVGIILLTMLTIWIPEKKNVRIVIMSIWLSLLVAMTLIFVSSPELIHSLLFLMSVPMFLLFIITWFFCYFHKRLSIINPLLVGIGFSAYLISTILKAYFTMIGAPLGYVFTDLHWITILIDILSFSIILVGFTREMKY